MVWPSPVTSLTTPTSILSAKQQWSGHVWLHLHHDIHPRCQLKYSGPSMSTCILNTTATHLLSRTTVVRPCPVTFLPPPTFPLCAKQQWSSHVRFHPCHHRQPPRPPRYSGPAMSAYILNATDIHFVAQIPWSGHVRLYLNTTNILFVRRTRMVRPCPVTMALSRLWSGGPAYGPVICRGPAMPGHVRPCRWCGHVRPCR